MSLGSSRPNVFFFFFCAGTLDNPIMVRSAGDEQFAGCTGYPVDSHIVTWLGVSHSLHMRQTAG